MYGPVMGRAQHEQVIHLGLTPIRPMLDVMSIQITFVGTARKRTLPIRDRNARRIAGGIVRCLRPTLSRSPSPVSTMGTTPPSHRSRWCSPSRWVHGGIHLPGEVDDGVFEIIDELIVSCREHVGGFPFLSFPFLSRASKDAVYIHSILTQFSQRFHYGVAEKCLNASKISTIQQPW
jgi:hypothetical protein